MKINYPAPTKVFLVDPHPLIRRGVHALLRAHEEFVVCGEAGDTETAFLEIQRLRPEVVITEMRLDTQPTLELMSKIREFDPGIRIIALSVGDESKGALPAFKAGARGYVTKDSDPACIIEAIRRVMGDQMYFSNRVCDEILFRFVGETRRRSSVRPDGLSPREFEVLKLIGAGYATGEIAARLGLSVHTVEVHRAHIKQKAGLENAFDLTCYSIRVADEADQCVA